MPNPRLASRYAKSLLDLSIEQGQLEQVHTDMQWLKEAINQSKDFASLLRSPIINNDTKRKIVDTILKDNVSDLSQKFVNLLVAKNRESNLAEIIPAFINQYKVHNNIQTVKLTTATPVSNEIKEKIVNQVKAAAGFENIDLEESVNPDIIGGFVLEVGDRLVDASIAYDLKAITKQFKNNDFIYKIK